MLGGTYSAKFNAFFGIVTEERLGAASRRYRLHFLPGGAWHPARSTSTTRLCGHKHAMMASAKQTCLMVNHKRFGHSALHLLADLSDFDWIITDARADPELWRRLSRRVLPDLARRVRREMTALPCSGCRAIIRQRPLADRNAWVTGAGAGGFGHRKRPARACERLALGALPGDPAAFVGVNESGDRQKALDAAAHDHMLAALRGADVRQSCPKKRERDHA